jgi:NADH dehydrogenase FAD-containing subunit
MKLVVCGGGIGGSFIANSMLDHVSSLTLIEPKNYLEATPGVMGAIHSADFRNQLKNVLVGPKRAWDARIKHVQTKLVGVLHEQNKVLLSNGDSLQYDLLCISTGSRPVESGIWRPSPSITTIQARVNEIEQYRQKLSEAHTILILGAGVVGIEACCEMAERYPLKHFHLAVSDYDILLTCPGVVRTVAKRHLNRFDNVQVHFNCGRIAPAAFGEMWKIGNWEIRPDMVLKCFPNGFNTDCLPTEWLDKKQQVRVDEYLRVEGFNNIFVIGDINNASDDKSSKAVMDQGWVAFANMKSFCVDALRTPVQKFTGARPGLVLKLGPWESIVYYNKLFGWYGFLFSGSYIATIVRLLLLKRILSFATGLRYFQRIDMSEREQFLPSYSPDAGFTLYARNATTSQSEPPKLAQEINV